MTPYLAKLIILLYTDLAMHMQLQTPTLDRYSKCLMYHYNYNHVNTVDTFL